MTLISIQVPPRTTRAFIYNPQSTLRHVPILLMVLLIRSLIHADCAPTLLVPSFGVFDV